MIKLSPRETAITLLRLNCFEGWNHTNWSVPLNRKLELVEQYVFDAEAEHGVEFWNHPEMNAEVLINDFRIYAANGAGYSLWLNSPESCLFSPRRTK